MPTFNIANTNLDGWSGIGSETTETVTPGAYWYIGSNGGAEHDDWGGIYRATGIPQGATIISASLFLTRHINDTGGVTVTGNWWGMAVDSPANFNAAHTHRVSNHEARTAASVSESITVTETTHTSPSLVSIIQELVNRPGFSGDIGLMFESTTLAAFWPIADFSTPGTTPALTITWTRTYKTTRGLYKVEGVYRKYAMPLQSLPYSLIEQAPAANVPVAFPKLPQYNISDYRDLKYPIVQLVTHQLRENYRYKDNNMVLAVGVGPSKFPPLPQYDWNQYYYVYPIVQHEHISLINTDRRIKGVNTTAPVGDPEVPDYGVRGQWQPGIMEPPNTRLIYNFRIPLIQVGRPEAEYVAPNLLPALYYRPYDLTSILAIKYRKPVNSAVQISTSAIIWYELLKTLDVPAIGNWEALEFVRLVAPWSQWNAAQYIDLKYPIVQIAGFRLKTLPIGDPEAKYVPPNVLASYLRPYDYTALTFRLKLLKLGDSPAYYKPPDLRASYLRPYDLTSILFRTFWNPKVRVAPISTSVLIRYELLKTLDTSHGGNWESEEGAKLIPAWVQWNIAKYVDLDYPIIQLVNFRLKLAPITPDPAYYKPPELRAAYLRIVDYKPFTFRLTLLGITDPAVRIPPPNILATYLRPYDLTAIVNRRITRAAISLTSVVTQTVTGNWESAGRVTSSITANWESCRPYEYETPSSIVIVTETASGIVVIGETPTQMSLSPEATVAPSYQSETAIIVSYISEGQTSCKCGH